MKNKKSFKASILIVILIVITGFTYFGASPLFKQINIYNKAEDAMNHTDVAVSAKNIRCFNMLSSDLDKLDALKSELSEIEGFIGVYKYPDTELVTSINFGKDFSGLIVNNGMMNGNKGFVPYEYNEGLNKLKLLKIQEGEMCEFKAYEAGKEVPVVVTENDYFKLGDKIKLNLNVSNSNEADFPNVEPISVDAVVCGIVKKDVYLPALKNYKFTATKNFSQINDLIWVFTPDLSEYTKLFDYRPEFGQSNAKYYVLYEGGTPTQYQTIINKYGYYDAFETINTLGGSLQFEMNDFEDKNFKFTLAAIFTIYGIAAVCLIKEIIMLFYKKKD